MAEVFAINIEENISEDMYKEFLNTVSQKRKEKIGKYKFQVDAKRSLFASLLVRYIACCKMNVRNENIMFNNNIYGKPYLYGVEDQHFNISHSGKWVVCGWSTREIGVDVEVVDSIDLDIAKKFFCESEYLSILNTNTEERNDLFFDFWTLKESYIKYKGCGFFTPINSFKFDLKLGKVAIKSNDNRKPLFYRVKLDERHKLALCTEDTEFKGIIYISPNTIWEKLCK